MSQGPGSPLCRQSTTPSRPGQYQKEDKPSSDNTKGTNNIRRPMIGIPYIASLSERLQCIFKEYRVNMYHKPSNSKTSWYTPKTPHPTPRNVESATSSHRTERTLAEQFKEHQNKDKPTAVGENCQDTGHLFSLEKSKILVREPNWTARKVKEAIYIKTKAPSINHDQGYQLTPVYNQLLPGPRDIATATSHDQIKVISRNLSSSKLQVH